MSATQQTCGRDQHVAVQPEVLFIAVVHEDARYAADGAGISVRRRVSRPGAQAGSAVQAAGEMLTSRVMVSASAS